MLNDLSLLLDAAAEVGLDRSVCETFLHSSHGTEEVLRTVDEVHALGISSIPTLVIDGGKYVVSGAAEKETVAETLRQIVSERNNGSIGWTDEPQSLFQHMLHFKFSKDV